MLLLLWRFGGCGFDDSGEEFGDISIMNNVYSNFIDLLQRNLLKIFLKSLYYKLIVEKVNIIFIY